MSLFRRKKEEPSQASLWPPERFEPVLRSSICTGEKTAGFIDNRTGKYHDVMLIKSEADLAEFKRLYGIEEVKTIY